MKIAVVTDSNSGISVNQTENKNLFVLAMPFIISDEEFFEEETLSQDDFYKKLATNAKISTSQPSPGQVLDLWDSVLKEYDQILHIPMSSGLSESCNTAINLSKEYEGKVLIVDNQKISITQKASVYDALNLIEQGKTPEEIKGILESEENRCTIFLTPSTLTYLKKGGRITPAAALLGSLLNIKPILKLTNGKIDAYAKALNRKQAIAKMITSMKQEYNSTLAQDVANGKVFVGIASANIDEEALSVKAEIEKAFPDLVVEYNDRLSLSVSCHTGPGTLGVSLIKRI